MIRHLLRRILHPIPASLLSLLIAAPAAWAHARPLTYNPAQGSIGAAPTTVAMRFNETLEPQFSSLAVIAADGHGVNRQKSHISATDAKMITVALPALHPGTYTVHWIAVGLDAHRIQGDYKFTVKQ